MSKNFLSRRSILCVLARPIVNFLAKDRSVYEKTEFDFSS